MKKMNELNDKLFQDVLSLPSHLRTMLIDELIKSLNVPIQKEIDELWAKEAENRVCDINSGKVKSILGEKVIEDIQNRFKK
ncbi:MAG: addiction module antitoxin RelB [Promethearchaeota archaeon]|nr:MAG: addiction module antitoxin RelB [Candidatus Lokiarchaeota archaeon]